MLLLCREPTHRRAARIFALKANQDRKNLGQNNTLGYQRREAQKLRHQRPCDWNQSASPTAGQISTSVETAGHMDRHVSALSMWPEGRGRLGRHEYSWWHRDDHLCKSASCQSESLHPRTIPLHRLTTESREYKCYINTLDSVVGKKGSSTLCNLYLYSNPIACECLQAILGTTKVL